MRISVIGTCESAKVVRGLLMQRNYAVSQEDDSRGIRLEILENEAEAVPVLDGVDSELERRVLDCIGDLVPGGRVVVQRGGGNRNDRALVVTLPPTQAMRNAVELGILRGVEQAVPLLRPEEAKLVAAPPRRRWWKLWLAFLAVALNLGATEPPLAPKMETTVTRAMLAPLAQLFQVGTITHIRGFAAGSYFDIGDAANTAIRVNVVAGAAGGGAAQLQVRNSADAAWVNVGFNAGANLRVPSDLFSVGGTAVSGANVVDAGNTAFRVNCVTGCAGSSFADSSAFTFSTTTVSNTAFVVDDTGTNTVAENSAGAARMNTNRILYSMNTDATGTQVGTAGAPFRVDPTGSTTQPISAASLPLPTGAATSANQDGVVKDGAGDTTQANVSSGRLHVDGSGVTQPVSGTVTANAGSGTFTVGGTVTANAGSGTFTVSDPTYTDATGGTVPANAAFVAGTDGTNTRALKTDTGGELQVDVLSVPSNQSVNVAQIAATATSVNNGATDAGTQRVTISNDSTGEIRIADDSGNQIPSATAPPSPTARGLNVRVLAADPCSNEVATAVPIDIVTATTVLVATGVGGDHVYICGWNLITAGANNVALVAGTGATCGTSTAGIAGGATAAEGWNFAANGGMAVPNTGFHHARTESTGDSVCIITSAAVQLSGTIMYVIQAP